MAMPAGERLPVLFVLLYAALITAFLLSSAGSVFSDSPEGALLNGAGLAAARFEIHGTLSIEGPAPFDDAISEALSLLSRNNPVDYEFVGAQISMIAAAAVDKVHVDVATGVVTFPEQWRYQAYDRHALIDLLLCKATHIWLSRHDYRFYGEEAERYRIEQKVHQYILLN